MKKKKKKKKKEEKKEEQTTIEPVGSTEQNNHASRSPKAGPGAIEETYMLQPSYFA